MPTCTETPETTNATYYHFNLIVKSVNFATTARLSSASTTTTTAAAPAAHIVSDYESVCGAQTRTHTHTLARPR